MADCLIVRATPDHLDDVAANLRPEHVREVAAMTREAPAAAVRLSAKVSAAVFAGVAEGETLFVCGVEPPPLLADAASVWMLATPAIDRHALPAAKALRKLFRYAHRIARAEVLEQWLPEWYRKGLKWLLWLGWTADWHGGRDFGGVWHIHMVHRGRRRNSGT